MKLVRAALLCLSLSACVHMNPIWNGADVRLAERAWPYAQIAYNSYHREQGDVRDRPFALPTRFEPIVAFSNDDLGLAYDIVAENLDDHRFNLVFAFRGTEGGLNPLVECDWKYGNLRLDQQERAAAKVIAYLADPQHRQRGARSLADVVLIGHSLGGGIAMHTSFHIPGSWVYAFDTSPKFERPAHYQPTPTDLEPRRLSIAQKGEILKIVRLPAHEAPQIYMSVNCVHGGPVDKHSMLALAVCLTTRAAALGAGPAAAEALTALTVQPLQYTDWRLLIDQSLNVPACR